MKIAAIALAVVFFALAGLYFTGHLQFLAHPKPGAGPNAPHLTHGFVCVVLGVLSLVWLRFQSASATAPSR